MCPVEALSARLKHFFINDVFENYSKFVKDAAFKTFSSNISLTSLWEYRTGSFENPQISFKSQSISLRKCCPGI